MVIVKWEYESVKYMKKIIIDNIRNIEHLEFEIPTAGVHVITGENGIGKTTLFTCLSVNAPTHVPTNTLKNLI